MTKRKMEKKKQTMKEKKKKKKREQRSENLFRLGKFVVETLFFGARKGVPPTGAKTHKEKGIKKLMVGGGEGEIENKEETQVEGKV